MVTYVCESVQMLFQWSLCSFALNNPLSVALSTRETIPLTNLVTRFLYITNWLIKITPVTLLLIQHLKLLNQVNNYPKGVKEPKFG